MNVASKLAGYLDLTIQNNKNISDFVNSAVEYNEIDYVALNGDRVFEKFESLYIRLFDIKTHFALNNGPGYFFIIASPNIMSVIRENSSFIYDGEPWQCQGTSIGVNEDVFYEGNLARTFRCYTNPLMSEFLEDSNSCDLIIIGMVKAEPQPNSIHCGTVKIKNFRI